VKTKHFLAGLDEARVVAAIAAAERKSGGEIHVYVSHRKRVDTLAAARRRFHHLGLARTSHRKAVLIYFAPLSHQFAIWGDIGAHEKCGEEGWRKIIAEMAPLLKDGHLTDAVERAIKAVADALADAN
jgi:uncharacterized membrane protein